MDEMITARYTMTESDYVEVCVAKHRYSLRGPIAGFARIFCIGLPVLGVVAITMGLPPGADPESVLPGLVVLMLLSAGMAYLFHPKNFLNVLWYRHHWRMLPEATRSIEWGFEPEQLWARNELAESVIRWELFQTIVETPKCFLFFQGKHLLLWLPSHGFSSPGMLRTFTELARTKVPNYVVVGECQFPAKPESVGLDEL
jgi:YcxB-like protein